MNSTTLSLAELLAPMAVDAFLDGHWERRPLHLVRESPDYYRGLFSLRALDAYAVSQADSRKARVKVLYPPEHPTGRFDNLGFGDEHLTRFYDLFDEADSLVLNSLERTWPAFARLSASLGRELFARVQVNVYVTPGNSQGFRRHIDFHDVFVLQLEGEKAWKIYDTLDDLPGLQPHLSGFSRHRFASHSEHIDALTTPMLEPQMRPGDLLYVPRGFPHEAKALAGHSVHATLGIHPFHWTDVMSSALAQLEARDVRFRRALTPGALGRDRERLAPRLAATFGELLAAFTHGASLDAALEGLEEQFVEQQPMVPDGHFALLTRLDDVHVDTRLTKRVGLHCLLRMEGDDICVYFAGRRFSGPWRIEPALRFIVESEEFLVRDLPLLSPESQIVLVRRLMREGLLTMPGDSSPETQPSR